MEVTLANTVRGVVPVLLPEGELNCGGISTHCEEEKLAAAAPGEGAGTGAWMAARHGQEATGEMVTAMIRG